MDRTDRNELATGAALAGTGASLVAAPSVVNRGHGAMVRHQMRRAIGNKGGLSDTGKPVNPFTLPGRPGRPRADGTRRASAQVAASERYAERAKPFEARLARRPIGGGKATALRTGGILLASTGLATMADAGDRISSGKVRKADDELGISPQFGVGIPPSRTNPISPLALSASAGIMADFIVGASGKRLTRREKKAVRRGAYGFAGARGMLYSPLGFGRSNSA